MSCASHQNLNMKILLSDSFDPSLPGRLAKFGTVTDDQSQLPDCDVVLIRSKTKATADYIAGAPKLKIIIRGGVGLDNVDAAAAAIAESRSLTPRKRAAWPWPSWPWPFSLPSRARSSRRILT